MRSTTIRITRGGRLELLLTCAIVGDARVLVDHRAGNAISGVK